MKTKPRIVGWLVLLALSMFNLQLSTANAQGTAFTYQGRVTDNGTNFTGAGQFKFALVTSTNNSHQATASANLSGSFVTSYNLIFGGSAYVSVPAVHVTGGGGSGATATASISGGVVTAISPGSAGSGYTSAPTVTIDPPPANITYITYWSNDGTSSAGSEPSAAVSVAVTNGLFTVALGDTSQANMAAINAVLFAQPNLQLRIWFSDGVNGFAALRPVQNLTPTPYASFATAANSASNLLGTLPATQVSGTLASGNLPSSPTVSGTVTAANFSGNGAGLTNVNADLLDGQHGAYYLNAGNLNAGTLPLARLSGAVVTNTETGVTLSGAFSGNGSGLTNLNAARLSGSVSNISNIYLPVTTASAGIVYSGATPFLHVFGDQNIFAGALAGNLTMSGFDNTAVGYQALRNNTSGDYNTAVGEMALNLNTNGIENTAVGDYALYANLAGMDNTAIGNEALENNTNGFENTAVGDHALYANTTGNNNTALGNYAGDNITTGNNNIDIGNEGLAADSGIIRIGNQQTQTFIAGVLTGNGGGLTNVTAAALATPPGMALIPAGLFTMGNSIGDSDITNANPTNITVSAFYMDINLVTSNLWASVYNWATNNGYSFDNAGSGKAANHPVQTVDWYDSVKWSNARSQQAGLTPVYYTDAGFTQIYTTGEVSPYMNMSANGYRLPTEAEREKVARGGLSGQRFPWGNVITENLANYYGVTNSYSYDLGPNGFNTAFTNGVMPYTSPVGYFAPNGYGLYDMAGNVGEWCWDWYGTPYGQPTNTNPIGPATGSFRVLRGGVWGKYANILRCAYRDYYYPDIGDYVIGFRCVRGH